MSFSDPNYDNELDCMTVPADKSDIKCVERVLSGQLFQLDLNGAVYLKLDDGIIVNLKTNKIVYLDEDATVHVKAKTLEDYLKE